MNLFDAIKLSPERLAQLQICTAQDPVLLTLITTVITGWPELRAQVPIPIREYWCYRDEISVHNGVLFNNHRVIIPKLMQEEVLSRIHSSHLGIESCLRKAKYVVFWPGMSSQIKETVSNCQICAEFQASNPSLCRHMRSQTDLGVKWQPTSSVFTARITLFLWTTIPISLKSASCQTPHPAL